MPETLKHENRRQPAKPGPGRFLGQWWLLSAMWLFVAGASVVNSYLIQPNDLALAARIAAFQWLPWVLLTPVIVWLTSAFTIQRTTWHRNIWVHLAACVIIVGGLGMVNYHERMPPPFGRGMRFSASVGHGPPPGEEMHGGGRGDGMRGEPPHGEPPHGPRNGGPGGFGGGGGHFPGPPSAALMILQFAEFQLPIFWVTAGLAHALRFSQLAKDRERRGAELEARLTQARLQALRAQLNPHFLFNTLNSVASLVYDDPRAADEMIGSLSDLLRLTLTAPDRQEITLREELHFLDQYLRIEQARFGERLQVVRNIEPAALEAYVPILILQPLVENAVKHGIEEQIAPGKVEITAKRDGETMRLEVTDNGRGLAPADGTMKEGVGLGNTRARLKELYGGRGLLQFPERKTGGFSVVVQFPWRLEPVARPARKTTVAT